MNVRVVRMAVFKGQVFMRMSMRLDTVPIISMRVLMMSVVAMRMRVRKECVHMHVPMVFAQMQPDANRHQHTGEAEGKGHGRTQQQSKCSARKRRKRKVRARARCTQAAQRQHEQHQAQAITEKAERTCRQNNLDVRQLCTRQHRQGNARSARNEPFRAGNEHGVVRGNLACEVVIDAPGETRARNSQRPEQPCCRSLGAEGQ